MIGRLVFVGLLSVALAEVGGGGRVEVFSDEDTLRILTEEGSRKVVQVLTDINNASVEYDVLMADRLECLMWEYSLQKEAMNKSMTDAVSKGMQKNKPVSSFQCISNGAQETLDKLVAIGEKIPSSSEEMKQKGLGKVMPFRLVMPGLEEYVRVLYKTKSEEIRKTNSDDVRRKILGEVIQKMKLLETILEQIRGQMKDAKFKFFEDFVKFAFATDSSLKKTQREGAQKIQKCVD